MAIMAKSTKSSKKPAQSTTQLKKRIDELEKENQMLKKSTAKTSKTSKKSGLARNLASALLVIMAAGLLVDSILFIWLQRTILDTDTWTQKTSQIIRTTSVQNDIADKVTNELFAQIDVSQYVEEALPERAAPLSAPIASAVEGFVNTKTKEVLASDKFQQVWLNASRESHQSLINSIERLNEVNSENNSSDLIYINEETLMLNLRPVLNEVKQDLVARGITFLPQENVIPQEKLTFELAEINNLPIILGVYNALNRLSYWLPIMAVVLGAGAVFVSTNRRKALIGIVVVTIAMSVATVQVVRAGQYVVTQNISSGAEAVSVESATAIYQTITNDLITSLRWLMGALLVLGVFLFLSGPSAAATWLRAKLGGLIKNYKNNSFVKFLAANASTVIGVIGLLVAALIVLINFSSPWYPLILIVLGGLLSVLILAVKQELDR
jgi:hypothetical protein